MSRCTCQSERCVRTVSLSRLNPFLAQPIRHSRLCQVLHQGVRTVSGRVRFGQKQKSFM